MLVNRPSPSRSLLFFRSVGKSLRPQKGLTYYERTGNRAALTGGKKHFSFGSFLFCFGKRKEHLKF